MNITKLRRDIFYNPQLLSSRRYILSESIDGSFDDDQNRSEILFHRLIKSYFDKSEIAVTKGDQYYYKKFVDNKIPRLFEDYVNRIQQLYSNNGFSFLASNKSKWLVKTISIIHFEYNKFKAKWIGEEFDELDSQYAVLDNRYTLRFNVTIIHDQLIIGVYKLFASSFSANQEYPFSVIPYNFWTDTFEESVAKQEMIKSYARNQDGRAMTIIQENIGWFDSYVMKLCQVHVDYCLSCIGNKSYDPIEPDELHGIESTFYTLFSDYDRRVQMSETADEDYACLTWLIFSINELYRLFYMEYDTYSGMGKDHETMLLFVQSFFVDRCLSALTGLLSNYLNDLCVELGPRKRIQEGIESQSARIKELFTDRLSVDKKKDLFDLLLDVAHNKKPYEAFAYIYIAQKKKLLFCLSFPKMHELLGKPDNWKGNNYSAYLGKTQGAYRQSPNEYTDNLRRAIIQAKEEIEKII